MTPIINFVIQPPSNFCWIQAALKSLLQRDDSTSAFPSSVQEQHRPPLSQLVLLCTGNAPRSGQSTNHKQMMEITLAIYTAHGKIRYQEQGVVSTGLTAEQWAEHPAEPEQPKGSKTAK